MRADPATSAALATGPTGDPNLEFWRQHSERRARRWGNDIRAHDYRTARVFAQTQDSLLAQFADRRGCRILDVGCGNGLFTGPLTARHRVVGLDISSGMLRLASANGIRPVRSPAEQLPFADGVFDAACCVEMLQCVTDSQAIVSEMVRVVRPGGLVYLQTLNRESLIRRVLARLDHEARLLRMYAIDELCRSTDRLGITERTVIYQYYPLKLARQVTCPTRISNLVATSFAIAGRAPRSR
jgi:SAM-dependent methyltransferase